MRALVALALGFLGSRWARFVSWRGAWRAAVLVAFLLLLGAVGALRTMYNRTPDDRPTELR